MRKKTVRDLDVRERRVFLRADLNVPLDESGRVADDTRIRAIVPTVRYLSDQRARIIIASHLGRPRGVDESLRLAPLRGPLESILGVPMTYVPDCIGPEVQRAVEQLRPASALLLENLRFHPEEEANDQEFARKLASLADVYLNDAFGAAHRAHASTEAIAHLLPSGAGLLMERELTFLGRVVTSPERPYAAVIGGAKVSSKLGVLQALLDKVDLMIIGGGMANTFMRAEGFDMGGSRIEEDLVQEARAIIEQAERRKVRLLLPTDLVVADAFDADARTQIVGVKDVPAGWQALDIGPKTVEVYSRSLEGCRTVVWNGPMGVFEMPLFAQGSLAVGKAIAELTDCTTIVGGGETAQLAAMLQEHYPGLQFSHISTGGGATLEFLEGRQLPGVAALMDA
ncbi:MAG TPA: phosphoglycerate kinase [Dehalococcoidia bacterium]|nr:phosphoglycerate kinase [Dehalococcoidia bacterium]